MTFTLFFTNFFQFSGWVLNKFHELIHTIVYRTIGSTGCDYVRSCNRLGANDDALLNLKNTIPQWAIYIAIISAAIFFFWWIFFAH